MKNDEQIKAPLYSGMPAVELTSAEIEAVRAQEGQEASTGTKSPISISLESLDLEAQHNQSYGFVAAGTGCISNPGGPGC